MSCTWAVLKGKGLAWSVDDEKFDIQG